MLIAPLAADPAGWDWLVTGSFVLLFASLCGYLVWQAWRRNQVSQIDAQAARVPLRPDYRFQLESVRFRVLMYACVIAAGVPAGLAFGGAGAAFAVLAVVLPFMTVVARRRTARRRKLIAAVEARAPAMTPQELHDLVEALEAEHGESEMKPLRDLLQMRMRSPV